jgi:hypothetical protein
VIYLKKKLIVAGIAFLLAALVLAGCEGDEKGIEPVAATSTVAFQVTDKVTDDFTHVNVTFSEIKIHKELEGDNASWVVITSDQTTVDLIALNLSNINATLGVAEIEVGNYSKLWIHVDNATGVLNSTGEEVDIAVPSGWLKIQQLHLFDISKGNHTITVDIDLDSSIHTYQGGEKYKFVPVISSLEHRYEHKLQFKHGKNAMKGKTENRAPEIDLLINDTPAGKNVYVNADENITYDASGSFDPDGDDLNFTWEFGDDATAYGSIVIHSYADSNQPYKLNLTVSDNTTETVEKINIRIN